MPDSSTPHLPLPAATGRTAAGLLCIALATLMYEVLLTRIFSVTMWYHFAFVAISIAMLGMTVGALIVYVRPRWFPPEAAKRQLAVSALLFPVLMLFSFLTQLSIPFRVHPSVVAAYAIAFTYAVITVPFVVSGLTVCLALTRFPRDVGKLYAADLIGAAVGCVLLVWVLEITDGPTSVLVICALAALGALAFAFDTDRRSLRRWSLTLALLFMATAAGHTVLVRHQRGILRILYVKAGFEARPLYERWNSYSRVRVNGDPNKLEDPYAWGLSPTFPSDRQFYQLHLDIDTAAGTVITKDTGNPADFDHLKYDVTNIGYYIRTNGRVLVVGVGGGRDILSALLFGAREVTGVELNRNILDTVNGRFGDFSGHLDRNPRVHFVNDEARSFVAREQKDQIQYDFMQISLIDTWAATAAGAFVLSENGLYTVEAWDLFLEHLSDNGLLSVSRWYYQSRPGEVYRLTALASAALLRRGIDHPQQHMMIIRSLRGSDHSEGEGPDGIGTLLLSPSPIAPQDVARLEDEAKRLQFEVVVSPTFAADDTFARLASGRDLDAFTRSYPINIAAPTDDSPFFFNMLRLRDVTHPWMTSLGKSTHNMEAVFVLGTLLITVIVLTLLCIFVPLKLTTDPGALHGAGPLLTFFASIGLGFMLIETSQMQRLIVVLGHPTYGLTVVLFALLLSGGLGSWLTNRVPAERAADTGRNRLIVLLALLLVFGILTPAVAGSLQRAETPVRVIASAVMLGVPGLFMGMAFPLGMKLASQRFGHLTPWFWGTNGATSVCASVLAVAIALSWSISAAFWTGCLAYAVGLAAFTAAGARNQLPAEKVAKFAAAL
jgi:hypothetical protein